MELFNILAWSQQILASKKSHVLLSASFATFTEFFSSRLVAHIAEEDTFLSLCGILVCAGVSSLFVIVDMVYGILASRKEGNVIRSDKWGVTISKYVGITLFAVLSIILAVIFNNFVVMAFIYTPFFLILLREFISIGENIERLNRRKPYIFNLVDRIFTIIEKKFFNSIEELDITKTKKD